MNCMQEEPLCIIVTSSVKDTVQNKSLIFVCVWVLVYAFVCVEGDKNVTISICTLVCKLECKEIG